MEALRDRNQQLESENARLAENSEKLRQQTESLILETEVFQKQIQELQAMPTPEQANLGEVRDRILVALETIRDKHFENFRAAKGADSEELFKKRLNRYIKDVSQELKAVLATFARTNQDSVPPSEQNHTPDSRMTWEEKALDILDEVKWDG